MIYIAIMLAAPPSSGCQAPVPVEHAHVASKYGPRQRFKNFRKEMHKGVDFASPAGTPIRSLYRGRVSAVVSHPWHGNTVSVVTFKPGGKQLMIIYHHLKDIHVREGELVMVGNIVGTVGKTGTDEGPHLHLETLTRNYRKGTKFRNVPPDSILNLCKYDYKKHDYYR